jgi:hypothetical protein
MCGEINAIIVPEQGVGKYLISITQTKKEGGKLCPLSIQNRDGGEKFPPNTQP